MIDNQLYQVPDDATTEEIDSITKPTSDHLDLSKIPADLHQEALQKTGAGSADDRQQETADIINTAKTTAEAKPDPGNTGTFLRSLLQGATFGAADEIQAALAPMIAENILAPIEGVSNSDLMAVGGKGDKTQQRNNLYNISLEDQTQQLKKDEEVNPTATLGGEIIGGGIGAAGSLAALAKVAPETAAWLANGKNFWDARKKDAIIGATLGGVTGAGAADPLEGESRLSGAVKGAAEGGIAGPVVGGTVSAGKAIADNIGSAAGLVKRATVGAEPLDILKNKIENPAAVKAQLESNPIGIIPDVAGDSMKGLTRLVGKTEGGRDIVSEALNNRSEEAVSRVVKGLKEVSPVDSYFGNLEDLSSARQTFAAPLYKEAFQSNPTVNSKEIDQILETPAGKKALSFASTQMQNARRQMGVPDAELREQAELTGAKLNGQVAPGLNLRSLDFVKKGFDDQIGAALTAGEKETAGILIGAKKDFVNELDKADVSGKYAEARKIYSDSKNLENHQTIGMEFNKMDPEEITSFLKDATSSEKEAFKIGVRKNLQDVVAKTSDGADPAKRIFGNSYKRDQIKAALENESQFNDFSKKLQDEIAGAKTKFAVLGGSRTDINAGLMDKNLMEKTMDQVLENGTSKSAWLGMLADSLKSRYYGINPSNAKQLAGILTDNKKGIQAMKDLISLNEKNPEQLRVLGQALKEIGPAPEEVRFSIGNSISKINKIKAPTLKLKTNE